MRMKIVKAVQTTRAVKASVDHAYNATFFVGYMEYLGEACQTYCKCTGLQPARMAASGGNAAEVDLERS